MGIPGVIKGKKYDYLVVGAGLFGAVFAGQMAKHDKKVLVIDRRDHIAGNAYTENKDGINVHKYGAHIFHTNDERVWKYVNSYATFNRYTNSPVANYKGEIYSLPFNMHTFNEMWGVVTPKEAEEKIRKQRQEVSGADFVPKNLEEQAISLVGRDIYEKLIKHYTKKQWGRPCSELPSFIIKRLPVRFTYDNNYFDALYQGIPVGGYTRMVENILGLSKDLEGAGDAGEKSVMRSGDGKITVCLGVDYLDPENRKELNELADTVVYTGSIDEYFGYRFGALKYRKVSFETEELDIQNYQGNAVVNYTDPDTPYTRIIEHKWFEFGKDINGNDIPVTIISKEYSTEWKTGDEPYYPVNDEENTALYQKYREYADSQAGDSHTRVIFGGRLGEYRYLDMDQVIKKALECADAE